jgi:hypothetical protein
VRGWESADADLTEAARRIDLRWEHRALTESARAGVVRSFGWRHKQDIGVLLDARREEHRATKDIADERLQRAFEASLPVSDTRLGPVLEWRARTTDYLTTFDIDGLGLQEDQPLGYDVLLRVSPVFRALGSTRNFLSTEAALQWTAPLGDGLARMRVEAAADLSFEQRGARPPSEEGSAAEGNGDLRTVSDARVGAQLFLASPRTVVGRLVYGTRLLCRTRNYLRAQSTLGADGRLRGYPGTTLVGEHEWVSNLEFRTRSVDLKSVQLGAVAFLDAGTVLDDSVKVLQSAGVGLRWVLPQIDRTVWRLDFGFPVGSAREADEAPVVVSFSFGQAFDLGALSSAARPSAP